MAEDIKKSILIEFKSNYEEYQKQVESSAKSIDELKDKIKELQKTDGDNTAQIEATKQQLREQQSLYRSATKQVDSYSKAMNANEGSQEQLQAISSIYNRELSKQSGLLEKDANGNLVLSDAYQKAAQKAKMANDANNQFNLGTKRGYTNVGLYSDSMQGLLDKVGMMPGSMGNAANSVKGLGTQFKALLANPVVLVISAIVAAIAGLVKIIKSSDSGATWFAAQWEKISAIVDVARTRVLALVDTIKSLFSGNYRDASVSFANAVGMTGASFSDAAKAAKEYTYELDRIEDSENNYVSQKAKNKQRIAELEFNAADRSKTTAEREKALSEAISISENELKHEKKVRNDKLKAEVDYLAQKNNVRSEDIMNFINMTDEEQANSSKTMRNIRDNYEEKFKEIEKLYADVINADTEFYEENKRNISKLSGFRKEVQDDEEKKRKEIEDAKKKSADEEAKRKQKADEDRKKYLEAEAAAEQAQLDFLAEQRKLFREKQEEERQRDLEARAINLQTQAEIDILNGEQEFETRRKQLEKKRLEEVKQAKQTGADVALVNEKYRLASIELTRQESVAKLAVYGSLAGSIAQIFGEQTAIGKAAAVAQTAINTYAAAMAVFKDTPGPLWLRIAAAAATGLIGLQNIRKILAVNTNISKSSTATPSISTNTSIPRFVATRVNDTNNTAANTIRSAGSTVSTNPNQSITSSVTNNNGMTANDVRSIVSSMPPQKLVIEEFDKINSRSKKVEIKSNY